MQERFKVEKEQKMREKVYRLLIIIVFACLLCGGVSINNVDENKWKPDGLKVELMENPYGIDTENPAFSWYMDECGGYQKKYEIVLANTKKKLDSNNFLIDTGWIESNENTYVKIKQIEDVLSDNSVYYWKVRIMDMDDNVSEWSDIACFSTEVGCDWVATDTIWNSEQSDYLFIRGEINVSKKSDVEKALLSVTALSPEETRQYVYNVYLNGEYVGSGPARIKDGIINYNTFDVTEYLEEQNILGAICYTNAGKQFLCQLTVFYNDGTKCIVANSGCDSNWKVLDGDFAYGKDENMISTPYYVANAENINAYAYPNGWLSRNYHTEYWENPYISGNINDEDLEPYQTENMLKEYITPQSVKKVDDGHYIIDLGKEIVGGIQINTFCSSVEPVEVILHFGEELEPDGSVKYQMRTANVYEEKWTLKFGRQKYENIGMKTFRYVEIYSNNISVDAKTIQGVAIRQPFEEIKSEFYSSNELLNDIYDLTKYTIKATNQNLYVDSQSRERGAYEGDAWINMLASESFSDSYTLARVTNEYLYANRTWPAEYPMYGIMCAWRDYMYTGNIDSLRENYQLLQENIDDFPADEEVGLVKNDYGDDGFNRPLVDWPENERDGYAYDEATYNTVVNAVAYIAYKDMGMVAEELGKSNDSTNYYNMAQTIRNSMLERLYNNDLGEYSDGLDEGANRIEHYSQHATAYALYAKIYRNDDMKQDMIESLKEDNEIKTSVFSAYFLLQGLYDSDAGDYATELLLSDNAEDTHTWNYMLEKNHATITTEAWDCVTKDNMTFSHPWGASPAAFISNGIFGIMPTKPGFKEFQVKLQPGNVENAYIKMPTIKGEIYVQYTMENNMIHKVEIIVPANTTAELYLPINKVKQLDMNKQCGYYKIALSAGEYVLDF